LPQEPPFGGGAALAPERAARSEQRANDEAGDERKGITEEA